MKFDSKNVEKHLEEFDKIAVQLKLIGHEISAVILAQNLLDTLDQHDFSYFVSSFAILGGKREIEVDEVKSALRSEIAARQQRRVLKPPTTPIPSTAMYTQSNQNRGRGNYRGFRNCRGRSNQRGRGFHQSNITQNTSAPHQQSLTVYITHAALILHCIFVQFINSD